MVEICTNVRLLPYNTADNLVGAFEIRFRTLVYEQLETRETLTITLTPSLTLTGNCLNLTTRDVPDTTLPDTGFNRIVIYRIPDIPDSSKLKHLSILSV